MNLNNPWLSCLNQTPAPAHNPPLSDTVSDVSPLPPQVKVENKAWKVEAGTRKIDLELTTVSSNYHIELTPSDVGYQDRYVVQEVIKEMAKSRPLTVDGVKGFKGEQGIE